MSPLERHQLDLVGRLNSLSYFAKINVFAWSPGSDGKDSPTLATYRAAMAGQLKKGGKYGVSVFILEPSFDNEKPNLPGVDGNIVTLARVVELRKANMIASTGTLKSADEVALRICRSMSHWRSQAGQQGSTDYQLGSCRTEDNAISAAPSEGEADQSIKRDVRILTPFAQNKPQQVGDVTLSLNARTVTLSTGTDGATIYYTTDGSFPSAENSAALVYSTPFTGTGGATIRAAAYKTGLDGSNVTTRVMAGHYLRPGGTATYRRPGGAATYERPS